MNPALLILLAHVPFAVVALAVNLGPACIPWIVGLILANAFAVRFLHALARHNDRS